MDSTPPNDQLYEAVQEYGGVRPAGRALGVAEATIRRRLKNYTPELPANAFVPNEEDLPAPYVGEDGVDTWECWDQHQEANPDGVQRYILTSAQNNADVHEGFLSNLKALAAHLGNTQLMVSFSIYDRQGYRGLIRQGDSQINKRDVWWDRAIKPYAMNSRARLHERLAFCGELDVLATAKNPLSGLDSYCGRSSVIVPHNRFSFKCVESRPHQMPKEMFTTGSVTRRKFIQRKTGQVAHFHHVLGALLVEVRPDGYWHVSHLNAEEDGSFYHLHNRIANGKVHHNRGGVRALVLGDVHYEKCDQTQENITKNIIETLRPRYVVVHDLIDFTSRNHHNRDDALFKIKHRDVEVEDEIGEAGVFLDHLSFVARTARRDARVVVPAANHNDAFKRWLKETDWRNDPRNALFYLRAAQVLVEAAQVGSSVDPLQWAIQTHFDLATEGVEFLRLDQSYEVAGVELGIHGHVGPSGSRGSPKAFSRLGFKTFTGHTHSPGIIDGCYTVGVMGRLNMEYNVGPSKWMHAHGIIYPNGKRAFIFVKDGRWTSE